MVASRWFRFCGTMNYRVVLVVCVTIFLFLFVFTRIADLKTATNNLHLMFLNAQREGTSTKSAKQLQDLASSAPIRKMPHVDADSSAPIRKMPHVDADSSAPIRKMPRVDTSILAGVRKKGLVKGLPTGKRLKSMDKESMFKTYHSYVTNIDIICERKFRMGKIGDGGWEVCDDPPYRPIKPCIVYSFGINYDFSFDDDIAKTYECDVYSFDPSMKMNTTRRNDRIMFYKIGIGGKDTINKRKWNIMTLTSIRKMLKHSKSVIDVLKMDVETAEWPALISMMEAGELKTVRQLLMEFHTKGDMQKLEIFSNLEKLGFRRFFVHLNPACRFLSLGIFPVRSSGCQEVHFVNTNILS
ncbi:methyltransferase-like protein 24 [Gigantopelta aegis]|uniref:methyltransferase-like protein 24 n=1 Tax=Gigantopelta aegis TaxID=1735272 RepID=UPI001B889EEE|nr:methyltransferase-like protein 24 [Gigantopelta aegis]